MKNFISLEDILNFQPNQNSLSDLLNAGKPGFKSFGDILNDTQTMDKKPSITGQAAPQLIAQQQKTQPEAQSWLGKAFDKTGDFLNSPLGRGVLMGGIALGTGGTGLEALSYGVGTGAKYNQNQANLAKQQQNQKVNNMIARFLDLPEGSNYTSDSIKTLLDGLKTQSSINLNQSQARNYASQADERNTLLPTKVQGKQLDNKSKEVDIYAAIADYRDKIAKLEEWEAQASTREEKALLQNEKLKLSNEYQEVVNKHADEKIQADLAKTQADTDYIENIKPTLNANKNLKTDLEIKKLQNELANNETKKVAKAENIAVTAGTVVEDIDRALKVLSPFSSGLSGLSAVIPGSDANELKGHIDSVKSNIGIDKLLKIKESGAGLGQVPQSQLDMLASTLGNLDITQKTHVLKENLQRAKKIYSDIIKKAEKDLPQQVSNNQPQEGQTATNPKTGQKIIFRGGQWQQIQ